MQSDRCRRRRQGRPLIDAQNASGSRCRAGPRRSRRSRRGRGDAPARRKRCPRSGVRRRRRSERGAHVRSGGASRSPLHSASMRRSVNGYVLPSLNLLTAQRVSERTTLSKGHHRRQRRGARKRARRFRRARRDHQCASRPGGDALRTGARARHQVLARDRARRRHRPLDERGVGARRGGVGPQRHRHRAAQSHAREGLLARIAGGQGLQRKRRQAAALPRQDHRRRVGDRRSGAHAASLDRRHHRLRQIGRHQHHDPVAGLSAAPRPMPADHGRSQDARTFRL